MKTREIQRAPFEHCRDPETGKRQVCRGPNGRRLCDWCGTEIPKRRQRWCSDECSTEFVIRRVPSVARWHVEQRDKGVCALCGRDTARIDRWLAEPGAMGPRRHYRRKLAWLRRRGLLGGMNHLWEMDHVVPVVMGGGGCGLDNLRTLCIPCHKAETAKLAAARAEQRRAEREAEDAPLFSGRHGPPKEAAPA